MIRGSDFVLLNRAEEKMGRGETLTLEEHTTVQEHPEWLMRNMVRYCGCGCGEKLEPRVDGVRHTLPGKGEVNADCFYAVLGDELDEHPIPPPRVRRRS